MSVELDILNLVGVSLIAIVVSIVVSRIGRFPYTVALLIAGLVVSILSVDIGITFTHDTLLYVLVPPLIFEGGVGINIEHLREKFWMILALAGPGLILSVPVLGFLGQYAFGLPLLSALLFGAIILPTDPVSILALFKELGAPEDLSIIVEGESLMNDGIGVVVFTALTAALGNAETTGELFHSGADSAAALFQPGNILAIVGNILVSSVGGLVVGLAAAIGVYLLLDRIEDQMTEIVLTLALAYGCYLVAEHYFHVSGVIAAATAGIVIGNFAADSAMTPRTKVTFYTVWEAAAFLIETLFFLVLGAQTPIRQIISNSRLIVVAIVLVLAVRVVMVYGFINLLNPLLDTTVPRRYQHVVVWGGVHASIPIALVLGLDPSLTSDLTQIRAMVFGVAAFSLLVQGLTMPWLLDWLGIGTRGEEEKLYELLVGRARAVDRAIEAAEDLRGSRDVPFEGYDEFIQEYRNEKEDLNRAISKLFQQHPEIRRERVLIEKRRVLAQEKSAILDAIRSGTVSDENGQELLNEVDLKIDSLGSDEGGMGEDTDDEYRSFWRSRLAQFGIEIESNRPET